MIVFFFIYIFWKSCWCSSKASLCMFLFYYIVYFSSLGKCQLLSKLLFKPLSKFLIWKLSHKSHSSLSKLKVLKIHFNTLLYQIYDMPYLDHSYASWLESKPKIYAVKWYHPNKQLWESNQFLYAISEHHCGKETGQDGLGNYCNRLLVSVPAAKDQPKYFTYLNK